ncbi:MAG: SDR family oxidoreductase [Caulobacteraceae bacterium]
MRVDLSGRTALVTGASSGFGWHFAKVLAANGAHVVAAARRTERLRELVAEIEAAGGSAEALTLDVTDAAAVEAAIAALPPARHRRQQRRRPQRRRRDRAAAGGVAPHLRDQHRGGVRRRQGGGAEDDRAEGVGGRRRDHHQHRLDHRPAARPGGVRLRRLQGRRHPPDRAPGEEWARYGIRVNALAPGYFVTDLNREFLASDFADKMLKRIPQRRYGEFADLDGPLLLLASDASAYMTGATIAVDGGHLVSVL